MRLLIGRFLLWVIRPARNRERIKVRGSVRFGQTMPPSDVIEQVRSQFRSSAPTIR
jgi:hypothetical protein